MGGVALVSEETFPAPQNDREDHESVLIDEVMLHQRVDEVGTAVDQDVPTVLLLQLGDLLSEVPA
jgi:hypothetical protein